MATLQSPGVQVSVVNESFYTSAAPGTVPMIFVASAQDKINPSGVVAPGTTAANAGKVYLLSSQRDLTDTFGVPQFITDASGNPVNAGEQNEYGLQAAYSLLGVSSAAYVVRAPIDLGELSAQSSAPAGDVANGTYWLDTTNSVWGIFEWNGTIFVNKTPLVIDDSNVAVYTSDGLTPLPSVGLIGSYAIVVTGAADSNVVWLKNNDGNWVAVGSNGESWSSGKSSVWTTSWPVVTATAAPSAITQNGTITINNVAVTISGYSSGSPGTVSQIVTAINTAYTSSHQIPGVYARNINGVLTLHADSTAMSDGTNPDGKINISAGTAPLLAQLGLTIGVFSGHTVFVGPHTQYPDFTNYAKGSVYVKTTSPNSGQIWTVKQWSETTKTWSYVKAPVYANGAAATYALDAVGGGANIPVGTVYVESNFDHGDNSYVGGALMPVLAEFKLRTRAAVAPTTITTPATGSTATVHPGSFGISVTTPGSATYTSFQTITIANTGTGLSVAVAINNSGIPNIVAAPNADGSVSITHTTGGEIRFSGTATVLTSMGFAPGTTANFYALGANETDGATYIATNWESLTYVADAVAPSTEPADGTVWYDSLQDEIDILVHDGSKWVGYKSPTSPYYNATASLQTDPNGPIISATKPTTQSDGTPLRMGDIWVSTANGTDQFGKEIYVWNANTLLWVLQDPSDHTSPNGWVFADARWSTHGADLSAAPISELLVSNYVDPDAPDPVNYPRGTHLWNLRRSGFNVKQYKKNYIDINANNGYNIRVPGEQMSSYSPDRWVSISANNADGSGTFGRHAQRSVIVAALKAEIDGNTTARDTDNLTFNLITCPGYPETIQNMIGFNTDRGLTAFVIGDTPFRLSNDSTTLAAWGNNTNGALDNGDTGLVSYDDYTALYYPSGYTNDLSGNYIVVPPSHMMMRTYALSDQQSYPWFAPAGIRRGVVDNATSVGYVDSQTGEFKLASLPEPIRNVMANNGKVNPIATLSGVGLVAYGQYTRSNTTSALDRVNVSRLVAYLRRQLDILSKPYLFEPNDKITRGEIKNAAQSLLLELVGQRALYDFVVVCDESNNTPPRIDRGELWMDVAIEPVKAVEFIYIPIRLVNTGAIAAGTFTLA